MAKMVYKRKTYVIDKKFQFRFIAAFLVLVVISLVLFSAGFAGYYYIKYMMGENIFSEFIVIHKQVIKENEAGEPIPQTEVQPPVHRTDIILPAILINNLIILIVVSVIGIFYSHKIAGPVYRIQEDIKRVLKGEKDIVIKLRKKDKLHTLAEEVNKLIEAYNKK
jgi:methyl-accepting chemotaxis protein